MITKDNYKKVHDQDFRKIYHYCLHNQDKISNYMEEWHEYASKNPKRIPKTISRRIKIEKNFKTKYVFDNVLVVTCVMWIHKNVKLVDGEKSGEPFKMTLSQKWSISQMFGWYLQNGERLTKELLLMVASGFGKSTFLSALNTLFSNVEELFGDTKIFIGANSQQQANLVFDTTKKMIKASKYKNDFNFRPSINEMEHKKERALIRSMSSKGDNYEGIIPSTIIIDEIHAMKTSEYVDNLRKNRTKRRDMFVFEITTQGTKRGCYLDTKLDYVREVLKGNVEDDEKCFIVFENESIEEVLGAYEKNDYEIIYKSNPNLGVSQNPITLMGSIKEMINDPSKRGTTLTKNFNIPQNPETSFFSKEECFTKKFDENIFIGKNVFLGLDVAETKSYQNDFTCLDMMYWNPQTDKRYRKKWYFIPKWYENNEQERFDMIPDKSKYDNTDYEYFIENKDFVVVEDVKITQDFIIDFIIKQTTKYKVNVLKFGIDPAYADKIITYFNALTNNQKFCLEFRAERKVWTQDPINITKQSRGNGLVYENNKFTVKNFACANAKYDNNNYITITNESKTRKDGVSAELACNSAAHVWSKQNNEFGIPNITLLNNSCVGNDEQFENERVILNYE